MELKLVRVIFIFMNCLRKLEGGFVKFTRKIGSLIIFAKIVKESENITQIKQSNESNIRGRLSVFDRYNE